MKNPTLTAAVAASLSAMAPGAPVNAAPMNPESTASASTPKPIPAASFCYTAKVKGPNGMVGIRKAKYKPHNPHHKGHGVGTHKPRTKRKPVQAAASHEGSASQPDKSLLVCQDMLPVNFQPLSMPDLTEFMPLRADPLDPGTGFSAVLDTPLYPQFDPKDPDSWNWGPVGVWNGDDYIDRGAVGTPGGGGPGGGPGGGGPGGGGGGPGGGGGGGIDNPPGGIPEPATWAQMIAGFGLTGAAMRMAARRRKDEENPEELADLPRGRG